MNETDERFSFNKRKLLIGVGSTAALLVAIGLVINMLAVRSLASKTELEDARNTLDTQAQAEKDRLNELSSQVSGLNSTIGRLNDQLNELTADNDSSNFKVTLDTSIISTASETLRVAQYNYDTYEEDYLEKEVLIAKISIENTSNFSVYFGNYSVRGVTSNGLLIDSVDVHPDDKKGQGLNFELAPNGSIETYVYIPKDKNSITGIYMQDTSETLKL